MCDSVYNQYTVLYSSLSLAFFLKFIMYLHNITSLKEQIARNSASRCTNGEINEH